MVKNWIMCLYLYKYTVIYIELHRYTAVLGDGHPLILVYLSTFFFPPGGHRGVFGGQWNEGPGLPREGSGTNPLGPSGGHVRLRIHRRVLRQGRGLRVRAHFVYLCNLCTCLFFVFYFLFIL